MNRDQLKNALHNRRVMIVAQLSVLVFILASLLGAALIQPQQTQQRTIDLTSVTAVKPVEKLEPLNDIQVRAKAAYVWDMQTQTALYSKNETASLPLASITKLMTTMLAYELLNADTEAIVTEGAIRQEGSVGFAEGERISLQNLSRLALISSSNDAAYALAASVGSALGNNDPAAQFVAGMNIRAEELGLTTLDFKNPTGLDVSLTEPGATGSAKDVSLLLEFILENYPEILEPTQESVARVYSATGEYHDVENTNDAMYAIPNLLGSKTGFTDLAGGNLTIAFDAGFNRPIIITVLGSTRQERFTDVLRLVAAVRESLQ